MAELDEEVIVCPSEAVRETSEALRLVDDTRNDLEREARRLTSGTSGCSSILADDGIKRDPLIHALYRSSRHLVSLREILRLQVAGPLEDFWQERQDVVALGEGRKAHSSLVRAQTVANDTRHSLLEELEDSTNAGSSYHAKVQNKIQSCHRAAAAAMTALSTLTGTLSNLQAQAVHHRRVSPGVSVDGTEQLPRERHCRVTLPRNTNLPTTELPDAATAGPESRAVFPGASLDWNDGLQRSASTTLSRSCRKHSTADCHKETAAIDGAYTPGSAASVVSFFSGHAAPPPSAGKRQEAQGPVPVTRAGGARRHLTSVPVMEERRKLMSRASLDRMRAGGGGISTTAGGLMKAREFKGSVEETHTMRRIRKPTAAEQYAASVNLMHGRSTTAPRCRSREVSDARGVAVAAVRTMNHRLPRLQPPLSVKSAHSTATHAEVSEQGTAMATVSTARSTRYAGAGTARVSNHRFARLPPSSPHTAARTGSSGSGGGSARLPSSMFLRSMPPTVGCAGERACGDSDGNRFERGNIGRRVDAQHRAAVDSAVQEAMEEQVAQSTLDDDSLLSLFSASQRPQHSGEATRVRRRSLVRMHTMGDSVDSTAPLLRSQSASRFGGRGRATLERSPSLSSMSRARAAIRGHDIPRTGIHDDEAAAQRLAKLEQDALARGDELLALSLAAREEARVERHASRGRVHRRSRRSSPLVLNAATAAAVATGGQVSDAVLALQFQDIDANDFETLLTLDEQGGFGGRTCGGGRGLSEKAVEDLLRSGKAAAGGLEENCAICLVGFELGEEIATLPCRHTFHDKCIRKWLLMRNRCPTDMQPVVPDSPGVRHEKGSKR